MKHHDNVTVVLTIAGCGDILPPMIILPVKTDRTIKDLTVPDNPCVAKQEKAWIDELLMMVWYKKIWLRYVCERTK